MNQDEINELEWKNSNNWHGPKWLSVYYSKKDTRILVPKQIRWMGLGLERATPNFAQPLGVLFPIVIFILIFLIGLIIFKIS